MNALFNRVFRRDTSNLYQPIQDPLHPHLVRCPIPPDMEVSETTRIVRLVNGAELADGV